MCFALCVVVRLGGVGFGLEAGTGEGIEEIGLGDGGPEGGFAAGLEGASDGGEAAAAVDAGVAGLDHGGGAVVYVEEDGVEGGRAGGADDLEDVAGDDLDAAIIEELAVYLAEKLAVPCDDLGEEFGDLDAGVAADELEYALEAEAEAEAADEDTGIGAAPEAIAG